MRRGASVVELRAFGWYNVERRGASTVLTDLGHWMNIYPRLFWRANHTLWWWYGARSNESVKPPRHTTSPLLAKEPVLARDLDVIVSWSRLRTLLERIASVGASRARYIATGDLPLQTV